MAIMRLIYSLLSMPYMVCLTMFSASAAFFLAITHGCLNFCLFHFTLILGNPTAFKTVLLQAKMLDLASKCLTYGLFLVSA